MCFLRNSIDLIRKNFHKILFYNGHTYAVSRSPLSWSQIIELNKTTRGYPIKISSIEENTQIIKHFNSVSQKTTLLIGLSDYEIEGDWRWFDSSKPIFSKWAIGEPNNYNSNEDFAVIYLKPDNGKNIGEWNDVPPTNTNKSINRVIFEWDFELKF